MADFVMEKDLAFNLDEYRKRLEDVRGRMQARGLDALLVHTPENILYLSGFQTPGYYMYQCLVVPAAGEPVLIHRRGEVGNFLRFCWLQEHADYQDIDDPAQVTAEAVAKRGLRGKRIGVELTSWFLTSRHYLKLQEALGGSLVDASGTVEGCRLIKSGQEIAYIRQAARASEAAMRAAIDAVRVGATDNDVTAELHRALFAAGSEYVALGPFVAAGYKSTIMHGIWGRKRIEKGESIILEIAGCIHRYHAGLMRPVSVGKPSDRMQRMSEASEAANREACEMVKPGVTAGEVHRACNEVFERSGLAELRRGNRSGYSIGLAFPPDWGEGHILSLQEGEPTILRPGMVFHIPSAVREYGKYGTSFSETVLVTETGHEVLTRFERTLFVRE